MSSLTMESGTADFLHLLEDQVHTLHDDGKVDEARQAADTAVGKARSTVGSDADSKNELAHSLEVKADLHRSQGEMDEATADYQEALGLLGFDRGNDEAIGRVCASLAVVHDSEERTIEAKSLYERSIACFERLTPPALLDVADLSNNLAFIYEAEDNFDQAETLFLKALRISHEEFGQDHEQTASFCNNVGGLYFKADYAEQAREMHMMALESRTKLLGEQHLDTAQSHANLALVYVKSDEINSAKRHFDSALKAYEGNLAEGAADYEITVANYSDVLKSLGEEKGAQDLEKRAADQLAKA
ncbi:tetratricopeptide repeat protein [Akkermansiaceae bacterium]|nr:tetratricopeptide repeat protein [Akkermansiaceae bacterium]MDB4505399.1 tetratricopeptide repeat protein [bacterium]MDA8967461.1 tetratricopeptide repeat protein [Akkermansiaceae bacterium]MDB4142435.1 tetratricopeptide repeat protein [Akkermansiaceae bacterium]MDB4296802.1 tetratricopeptide repeat protein [Akkermansiaceae bacterium]